METIEFLCAHVANSPKKSNRDKRDKCSTIVFW